MSLVPPCSLLPASITSLPPPQEPPPLPDTFLKSNTHQQAIDTYSAKSQEELWQCRHHTLQGGLGQ